MEYGLEALMGGYSERKQVHEELQDYIYLVAPQLWQRISIKYTVMGTFAEYLTNVVMVDGTVTPAWDPGEPFLFYMRYLRRLEADTEGRGSWYTCELYYEYHTTWNVRTDAQNEPEFQDVAWPEDYLKEVEMFDSNPELLPSWLAEKYAAALAAGQSEEGTP